KGHIKRVATIVLFTSFGFILVDQAPVLSENLGALLWITVGLNLAMIAAVTTLVRFAGLSRRENIAISVEHLMRQEGTAVFIAVSIVGNTEMSLPMTLNTPVALVVVLVFVATMRRRTATAPA